MKRNISNIRYLLLFLVLGMTQNSCIEEYVADVKSSDIDLLVVDGAISANTTCEFVLSRSYSLNDPYYDYFGHMENEATIAVVSSDGIERYDGYFDADGVYYVPVGSLDPNKEYQLRIVVDGDTYLSDPQKPIDAPGIEGMSVAQERDDHEVELRVTTEENHTGVRQYLSWDYSELWEVRAQFHCNYVYDPDSADYVQLPFERWQGWKYGKNRDIIVASTGDYLGQRMSDYPLYVIQWTDDRVQTLYQVTLRQSAISLAEYEYQTQRKNQNTEMGGLFTPMPSELPSNIHCTTSNKRAIGFVGVRGWVAEYVYYVSRYDVEYNETRRSGFLREGIASQYTPAKLYASGYQICSYMCDPMGHVTVEWGRPWISDVREWGASLERPDNWPEVEKFYKDR